VNGVVPSRRGVFRFQVVTGVVLILVGLGLPRLRPFEAVWLWLEWPVSALGLFLVVSAGVAVRRLPTRVMMGCGLCLWSVLAAVGVAEVAFRWVGFDFHGAEAAARKFPPYYREPRHPSGTVFFRRHGPDTWTGQPIRAWLELSANPASEHYRDEPVITVRYDALGFRAEELARDWEIAVAGDSFVELGCLAHADLFTTLLASFCAVEVRNLGASNTGPWTHLHYLEAYGIVPGLRRVVIVFYEGNDLQDIAWESQALEFHARTGKRGYRTIPRQTSLLGALRDFSRRPPREGGQAVLTNDVMHLEFRQGRVPVTLAPFAPHPADLEPRVIQAWEGFLEAYRAFGQRHGVELLLAYMPCKARVLEGVVRRSVTEGSPVDVWTPTPLPAWVAEGCRRHGIPMIDLTPGLVAVVEAEGLSPFNTLVETHLNAVGSGVVARLLANHLGGEPGRQAKVH
jgi:hypothetical protein